MQSPTPGLHAIVLNVNVSLSGQSNAESDSVKHSQRRLSMTQEMPRDRSLIKEA